MNQDEVKQYWEGRAQTHLPGQKTTLDVYLREIEYRNLASWIALTKPKSVLDVGCGDGKTTIRLARELPDIQFVGVDYSTSMISSAINDANELINLKFEVGDILNPNGLGIYDLVYTNRCLINLTTWELQQKAIFNLGNLVMPRGSLVLIENLLESQNHFNGLRRKLRLDPIPIREHNLFFSKEALNSELNRYFRTVEIRNLSSTYYVITRVFYSFFCKITKRNPNYTGSAHRFASRLRSFGDFGPINLIAASNSISID